MALTDPSQIRSSNPVLERMASLSGDWEQANDGRCVFLSSYMAMTQNMLSALDQDRFHDCTWVSELLHHFAGYYFNALEAYDREDGTPPVWQMAHDTARDPNSHVLQSLFLGINAHINYDLVLAVADMLALDWQTLTASERQARYQDHCMVNQIIAETIDRVQDTVVEKHAPFMDLVDTLMGPIDEWLITELVAQWRDEVWDQAIRMVELADDESREYLRRQIESRSLNKARWIVGLQDRPRKEEKRAAKETQLE